MVPDPSTPGHCPGLTPPACPDMVGGGAALTPCAGSGPGEGKGHAGAAAPCAGSDPGQPRPGKGCALDARGRLRRPLGRAVKGTHGPSAPGANRTDRTRSLPNQSGALPRPDPSTRAMYGRRGETSFLSGTAATLPSTPSTRQPQVGPAPPAPPAAGPTWLWRRQGRGRRGARSRCPGAGKVAAGPWRADLGHAGAHEAAAHTALATVCADEQDLGRSRKTSAQRARAAAPAPTPPAAGGRVAATAGARGSRRTGGILP